MFHLYSTHTAFCIMTAAPVNNKNYTTQLYMSCVASIVQLLWLKQEGKVNTEVICDYNARV